MVSLRLYLVWTQNRKCAYRAGNKHSNISPELCQPYGLYAIHSMEYELQLEWITLIIKASPYNWNKAPYDADPCILFC